MAFYTNLFFTVFALLVVVTSVPIHVRDVFVPPVTYPHAGTVWKVGQRHNVTWDVSNPPAEITNTRGVIVLAKGRIEDWDHPLASGFNILDGFAIVQVPHVTPADDYAIVVFGDSGNYGSVFTIES